MTAWAEWKVAADDPLTGCPGCQEIYRRREPPQEPPCDTCRVELLPGNREAAKVYQMVKGQVLVAGMGTVIGLNHLAVWEAIDRYQVERTVECFEKVIGTFGHMLAKQRDEESDEG